MARTKGSDDLYKLIHALTTEEKGYFKKYALRHSYQGNKTLELFDLINAQTTFEETSLKKKFKGYADLKLYLRNMITDALTLFLNSPENTLIHTAMLISRAAILERKGLTKPALKELKKGKELAHESEFFLFEHWFATREMNLNILNMGSGDQLLYERKVKIELEQLLKMQHSIDRFTFERKKINALLLKMLRQADNDIVKEDIDFDYFTNRANALTVSARRHQLDGLTEYYHVTKDAANEYATAMEYLALGKKMAAKTSQYATMYSRALGFAGRACINSGKVAEAEKYLLAMLKYKTPNGRWNNTMPAKYVRFMFLLYTDNKLFEQGKKFLDKAVVQYPDAFEGKKENFHYDSNIASSIFLRFITKDYKAVIISLNDFDKKLMEPNSPVYLRDVELLRLMIQVELKNYELLPGMVRAAIPKLKKLKMHTGFEKLLLRFFSRVTSYDIKAIATDVKAQLLELDEATYSNRLTPYFLGCYRYTDWLNDIATGKR